MGFIIEDGVDDSEDNIETVQGSSAEIVQEGQPAQEQVAKQEDNVEEVLPEKYRGKKLEDIVKMHQEAEKLIGRQAKEVHEVRSMADELLKRSLATPVQKEEPVQNQPEVDFFENPAEAVAKTVENHPAVKQAKQAAAELQRMKTAQKLAEKHPDFATIAQDTGFVDWVKASPIRLNLYAKADAEFDFDSADELLSTYKSIKQVQQQVATVDNNKQREQQMKAASVDVGGTGEASKKVYRRADLIRLRMENPDRYMALQDEIMAAYADGRVR